MQLVNPVKPRIIIGYHEAKWTVGECLFGKAAFGELSFDETSRIKTPSGSG